MLTAGNYDKTQSFVANSGKVIIDILTYKYTHRIIINFESRLMSVNNIFPMDFYVIEFMLKIFKRHPLEYPKV